MSCARIAELPLAHYHSQVGAIWRSRNDEPEQQVFEGLPEWMDPDQDRTQDQLDICRLITEALDTLSLREAKVLQLRYFADCTFEEIGNMYGVTRERIRQIESKALRKMKHPSRFDHLRQYHDLFSEKQIKTKKPNSWVWHWTEKNLPVEEDCSVKLDSLIQEEMLLQKYLQYKLNRLKETTRVNT